MADTTEFRVVIVGAGIAGLALANMLEKHELDYILLESHPAVVSEVGASIGLFPHGLRILDQLGLYQIITKSLEGQIGVGRTYMRRADGSIVTRLGNITEHMIQRHGYPFLFFDRHDLLQILYNSIKHKDRVLVRKSVSGIDLTTGGVRVTCADGSGYSGTLVVGADGVHSAVRGIMRGLAAKLEPGYFDLTEESRVSCFYRCSFGIAQHVPSWPRGDQQMVFGANKSQLVVPGPDNKVYWFLFEKLPKPVRGQDIPRFTKEDEAEMVERNSALPITEEITFGDVYKHRISSALTPLHEVVYEKWYFKRIITIGDSAHKPNPISGQGGNLAIESCADLLNSIICTKSRRGGSLTGLDTEEIIQAFAKVQALRKKRSKVIVSAAHRQQALFAYENPILSYIINEWALSLIGTEPLLSRNGFLMLGATTIKSLPVPHQPRLVPFNDELPTKRVSMLVTTLAWRAFLFTMCAALLLTVMAWRVPLDKIETVEKYGFTHINWFGDTKASRAFDKLVNILAIPLINGSIETRIHLTYFLSQLISPLLIYSIEGHRVGNQGTILALPSLFLWAMQLQGIGRVAPIHALFVPLVGHTMPTGRPVPIEFANSLVPTLFLGYVIPTVLALMPSAMSVRDQQLCIALWRIAPVMFNLLTRLLPLPFRRRGRRIQPSRTAEEEDVLTLFYENRDVSPLKSAYRFAFSLQAMAHLAVLTYIWSNTDTTLHRVFLDLPNLFKADMTLSPITEELSVFLRYEMAVVVAVFVCSNFYSVWDLRRAGYVKTETAIKAAVSVMVGQFLFGPGATWAGLWYWRETVLSNLFR